MMDKDQEVSQERTKFGTGVQIVQRRPRGTRKVSEDSLTAPWWWAAVHLMGPGFVSAVILHSGPHVPHFLSVSATLMNYPGSDVKPHE